MWFQQGTPSEWSMQKSPSFFMLRNKISVTYQVNLILHMKIINRLENKPYINN